jgi:hypothetical protein
MVRQLYKTTEASPEDSTCVLGNTQLAQVSIMGAVTRVKDSSANRVYTMDDGTARIDVTHWVSEEETDQQLLIKQQCVSGTHVKIIGSR